MGRGRLWIVVIVLLAVGLIYVQRSKRHYTTPTGVIFSGDRDAVAKVAIRQAGRTLELVEEDGAWRIAGHDTLQIRHDRIDGLFDDVLTARRSTVMTEDSGRWSTYSVDDTSGTQLTLFDRGGSILGVFVFGPSRSDWSKSYVRIEPSPTVYLTDRNVVYRLRAQETFWGEAPGPIGVEADSPGVVEVDLSTESEEE